MSMRASSGRWTASERLVEDGHYFHVCFVHVESGTHLMVLSALGAGALPVDLQIAKIVAEVVQAMVCAADLMGFGPPSRAVLDALSGSAQEENQLAKTA